MLKALSPVFVGIFVVFNKLIFSLVVRLSYAGIRQNVLLKKELFFRTADGDQIMVSTYRVVGDSFQDDEPELWSPGQFVYRGPWRNFDLAPDGKRFAVTNRPQSQEKARHPSPFSAARNDKFVVLINAFDELRRVAPPASK